jgi:hypothetical protein
VHADFASASSFRIPSHLSGYQIGLSAGDPESAMWVGEKRAYVKESMYRKLNLPFYFVIV